jgi:hypothetical protein
VEDLARAVDRTELVGDVIEHWRELGNDAPTFAFAVNVEHSKHLAERFNAAGIPARHVDGETDATERDDAVAALRDGRVKVLTNCGIYCEGTDVPVVKTIVCARPTKSEGLFLQQAGRGARPCPGSPPFVLLDHAGCCADHGLPQEPREYTLEGRRKRDKTTISLPPVKDCPQCYALVPTALRVCECGYEWPVDAAPTEPLKENEGKLVELTPGQRSRLVEWNAIVEDWHRENAVRDARDEPLLKGGWCVHQWRRRTQAEWPPKGAKIPKLTAEQEAASAARRAHGKRAPEEPIKPSPIVVHDPPPSWLSGAAQCLEPSPELHQSPAAPVPTVLATPRARALESSGVLEEWTL